MLLFLPGFCDVLSEYEQRQADEPHPHLIVRVLRCNYPQQGRKPLCEFPSYPAVIGPQPSSSDSEPVFQHVTQFAESCFYYLHSKTGHRN